MVEKETKGKFFYPALIFAIWFICYLICTMFWEQKIYWDETSYLATARGIAENFDFSSRFNTVLGILKYGYPQNTHHYPLYSTYVAIFFKLFGASLHVAYFSTWLSGLVACIFIYLIMLIMTEQNRLYSFLTAIAFLFLPRVLNYCDTAMMEIPCCALLSIFIYFIFKDLAKGKLNPFLLGIASIWLYFFKSLFFGIIIGFIFLILVTNKSRISKLLDMVFYLGTTFVIYFIFTKFIFLPLAPMMNFEKKQEELGTYADFLGGFFSDIPGNLTYNLKGFIANVVLKYLPGYSAELPPNNEGFFVATPNWIEFYLFFLFLFYVILFTLIVWKQIFSYQRTFILFSIISIVSFNLIFNLLVNTYTGIRCRFNMIYLPLLLIACAVLFKLALNYIKSFVMEHRIGSILIVLSLLLFVYFPYYVSTVKVAQWNKNYYYNMAHINSEIVKKIIGDSKPAIIFFNTGTHTSWDSFPTRVIVQEATTGELKTLNLKLPQPVEYLFLQPNNRLFKENQDLILEAKPIIDNTYNFYGFDEANKVVVYRLNK